jgi:hypothetical protein
MIMVTETMTNSHALVRRAPDAHSAPGDLSSPLWSGAAQLPVSRFHPRSSEHRPVTTLRLMYQDGAGGTGGDSCLRGLFTVSDRYVRSVHTEYDSDTYKDSCVELFVKPDDSAGYFAIEFNCGGAFSLRYIEDPTRTPNRFARWCTVDSSLASTIQVARSMPAVVDPEITAPVEWWVEFTWPIAVMTPYSGTAGPLAGRCWRANAFKCGDETSHPHWATWAPIGEVLNFHQPQYFGALEFDR